MPQSNQTIAFQPSLVSDLPEILGCKDYTEYCDLIQRVDDLLHTSNIEAEFIRAH